MQVFFINFYNFGQNTKNSNSQMIIFIDKCYRFYTYEITEISINSASDGFKFFVRNLSYQQKLRLVIDHCDKATLPTKSSIVSPF